MSNILALPITKPERSRIHHPWCDRSDHRRGDPGGCASRSQSIHGAGTVWTADGSDALTVVLDAVPGTRTLSLDQAESLGQALIDAARIARSTPTPSVVPVLRKAARR